jgi:hypothetical protein
MDYEPLPDGGLDRARLLEGILISAATSGGASTDEQTYTELRSTFMQDHSVKSIIPSFIRTCRDLSTFRSHAQSVGGWAPRRAYIREALTPLFDHFEGVNRTPVDAVTSDMLRKFDAEGVAAVWQKALDRQHSDPEGAITAARTLLETVCKHILDEGGPDYDGDDLPALYAKTAALLNVAPSQHTEPAFKRILGGATSVVEGLGSLRNKIGDAHGQGKRQVKPSARHAQLAVNMAATMATFLIETWLSRKSNS